MRTMVLALGGAAAAAWMAVPVVDLSVRGSTDQRTVAGWRSVASHVAAPVLAIPAPRVGGTTERMPAA